MRKNWEIVDHLNMKLCSSVNLGSYLHQELFYYVILSILTLAEIGTEFFIPEIQGFSFHD